MAMDGLMERYRRHAAGEVSLGDRLAGAGWGHLVGDAVGVPYEFGPAVPAEKVRFGASGMYGKPPGTWSDDGALMLALLDSLLAKGFDTTDQATRALAWYRGTAYTPDGEGRFDVGNATSAALERFAEGTPAERCGLPGKAGNGSLMRILPLALVERETPDEELVDHAHRASRVTHGDHRAHVACALYVLIARELLGGGGGRQQALESAIANLSRFYRSEAFAPEFGEALELLLGHRERAGRGYVVDSFWSAWDAFASADSYEGVIRRAVAYGDDTDTTAAIAGGLAGLYWGIDGIPAEWLAGMRGKEIVWPLVGRLLARQGYRTSDIRVDWVDLSGVPGLREAKGRLGMTFLPGKRDIGMSGDHWRVLENDVELLRSAHGVDRFVLLVGDDELAVTRVRDVAAVMERHGIELVRYPIDDGGVPEDLDSFRALLGDIRAAVVEEGRSVVVACRGGLGRTGTVVASLLREAGLDGDSAIALARESRKGTIENATQEQFVRVRHHDATMR